MRTGEAGFTLVELMVVLVLVAILALAAAPSFDDSALRTRLAGYANDFVASAQVARAEAIKRRATVTLCASSDGSTCATSGAWEQGWIVTCESADGSTCVDGASGTLVLERRAALASGYRLSGDFTSVQFPSTGAGVTAGALVACRGHPPGREERQLRVLGTGRVAVGTTRSGTCS